MKDYSRLTGVNINKNDQMEPHPIMTYVQKFEGYLEPKYILEKMKNITGIGTTQIIKYCNHGENTIKVWVKEKYDRQEIYLFTYHTGSKWHLRTLDYENEIKENK